MDLPQFYFQCLGMASACSSGSIVINKLEESPAKIIINRSVRDIDENAAKGVQETFLLNSSKNELQMLFSSASSSKVASQSLSPNGSKEVNFTNAKSLTGGDPTPLVEIVHHAGDSQAFGNVKIDLSAIHGAIIGDTWFGGTSWSHDEKFVAYVAKMKVTKTTSIDKPPQPADAINKFDFVDDWGEKYVDVCNLGIFLLDTTTGKSVQLPGVDISQFTIGQPQFIPPSKPSSDEEVGQYRLAYTAWNIHPRRLGMIYCYHRPCSIFMGDITKLLRGVDISESQTPHILVSRNVQLARCARAAPDGRSLVFLGSRRGYLTHGGCSELFRVSISETGNLSEVETIIGEVDLPSLTDVSSVKRVETRCQHMSFPGLYLDQLPSRCFVDSSGMGIICSSLWGSTEEAIFINMESKEVIPLSARSSALSEILGLASIQVLDTVYSTSTSSTLFSFSAPNSPARVGLLTLHVEGNNVAINNISLGPKPRIFAISNKINLFEPIIGDNSLGNAASMLQSLPEMIDYQIFAHHDENGIPFESILITPSMHMKNEASSPLPVVLVPHGGPHSCFSTAFVASYVYLAIGLKCAVLYVNYRGSTGFGQRSITCLAGAIGTVDVQDMMTCLRHALTLSHPINTNISLLDSAKVAVCGGSHGGFLGAHLSAQFPQVFHAAALRNPVTDIASMVGVSDIPDWCYVESLGTEQVKQEMSNGSMDWANPTPSLAHLVRMREVSPVHVGTVQTKGAYLTPTLICLGMKDRRVPPSQGVAFYQILKLNHGDVVPLSLMTFPEDVHAIDLPSTEAEHWIAIAKWFRTHLKL